MNLRYENRYSNHPAFIDLGPYSYDDEKGKSQYFQLYAIIRRDGSIDFGAKYGPEDSEYLSGESAYNPDTKQYTIYCGHKALLMACSLYFANHHNKGN